MLLYPLKKIILGPPLVSATFQKKGKAKRVLKQRGHARRKRGGVQRGSKDLQSKIQKIIKGASLHPVFPSFRKGNMPLILAAHHEPLDAQHEFLGGRKVPVLKETRTGSRYYLLKDSCEALKINYSKVRSKIHRGKIDIIKLVLAGRELQDFKAMANFETTASHLAFVSEAGFRKLLLQCGIAAGSLPPNGVHPSKVSEEVSDMPDLETCHGGLGASLSILPDVRDSGALQAENAPLKSIFENSQLHPISPSISRDEFDVTPFGVGGDLVGDLDEDPNEDLRNATTASSRATSADLQGGTPTPCGSPACRHGFPHFPDDQNIYDCVEDDAGPDIHDNADRDSDREDGRRNENVDIRERMPDVDEVDLRNGVKSVIKFKSYTLQDFDMTNLNHAEFHGLREFFSTPRGLFRGSGRARNAQTIAKSRERICGYLGWLKQSGRKKQPSFEDFRDLDLFLDKYVDGYLVGIRGLAHGSVANAITAAIDVHKYLDFLESESSVTPRGKSLSIARLQNRRNKEQTLAERERQGSVEETGTTILWEQFLEAVRCQRRIVDDLWQGGKAIGNLEEEVQKYLALAFYAAIPPSRSKEIRLLADRILTEKESRLSLKNHIALIQGRHAIVVSDYKNRLYNGSRDTMELPNDDDMIIKYLTYLLKPEVRVLLTKGRMHGFLFCKRNGDAFENAGDWTTYLGNIVQKHIGLSNISSNALRHSFTTFMESVADGDHVRLRESTASAMRHNVRMQQKTYNNTPAIQRKRKAVEFASGIFKRIVLEKTPETQIAGADIHKPTPLIGALVGTRLSEGIPAFGKVVRIEENDEALVMLLKLRETDPMTSQEYVADIGNLLRRSIARELLWPVDGSYNREKGFYEILTSLGELERMLG